MAIVHALFVLLVNLSQQLKMRDQLGMILEIRVGGETKGATYLVFPIRAMTGFDNVGKV